MQDIKIFKNGGLNLDDAIEDLAPNEYLDAYNVKLSGVSDSESGYVTNVEATSLITYALPAGINKTIGSESFESIRKIIDFTYNSNGYHRISETDFDTSVRTKLFENKTDSGGIDILPLTPTDYVKNIKLIEDSYLFFLPSSRNPSIVNLDKLRSSYYGVVTQDDISLIKAQPTIPISVKYQDDPAASSNLLVKNLCQFRYQFIYIDNEPSAWSTISRREVPSGVQASQTDVTKDNNLRLALNIGTNRVKEIRVAYISNESTVWKEIKNIKRVDVIALTSTDTNISTDTFEAYNPATNEYIFIFYNNGAYLPIDVLETDLDYDHVPLKSQSAEIANGNVLLLGNNTENYDIPTSTVSAEVSYIESGLLVTNNNVAALSVSNRVTTLTAPFVRPISSRRGVYRLYYKGTAHTGDILTVREQQFSGGSDIFVHTYLVTAPTDGNTLNSLIAFGNLAFNGLGYNVYYNTTTLEYEFTFTARNKYKFLDATVMVADATTASFNSKRSIKLNSAYEGALFYYDRYGRYYPPVKLIGITSKTSRIKTVGYGASSGNVPAIKWTISGKPPIDAVGYQVGLTKNLTHLNWVDINAKVAENKGAYNATSNVPSLLTPFTGSKIGDYYQVSQGGSRDLGNGVIIYGIGDYIIFNGTSFDRIPYSYIQANKGGIYDLSNTSYITLYIGSLNRFNKANYSSVINYDFSEGDRCSIYYATTGTKTFFASPSIETEIVGYDTALNILRIRKPTAFNPTTYLNQELLIELYTPKKNVDGQNVIYELGKSYTITNGVHDTLTDVITEADSFIKTRQYLSAIDYTIPETFLVEDANYSDFYISNYYSYGRGHLYNSLAKQNINKADIRFGDVINTVLNINKIGRFFIENVKTYDYTKGGIQYLIQRGNQVICMQELEFGYIPIFQSIIEDQAAQQNVAISFKLLNDIRYPENNQAGVGLAWESIAYFKGNVYFIDPLRSEPCRIGYNGLSYLKGKMSKFFKRTIQNNYKAGRKYIGWINTFDEDYILSVQYDGDIVNQISFDTGNWIYQDTYTLPQAYAIITDTNGTGVLTYNNTEFTPATNYVGTGASEVIGFSGNTKKLCIAVTSGDTTVNQFYFLDITNAVLNTRYESNTILVNNPNIPVAISIVNGEWTKDDGVTWQSTAGTVIGGDSVRVRQTSSSSSTTATNTTLTIGDKSDTYTITTGAAVAMSISYANTLKAAPYVNEGFLVQRNGVEIFRSIETGTGTITGVFAGDTIQVFQFHYLNWLNPSDATATLLVSDGTTIFNGTAAATSTTVTDIQQSPSFVLNSAKTYSITASSDSADATLTTATFNSLNSGGYGADALNIEIIDTTTSLVMFNVKNIGDAISHAYSFNYKTDANTLSERLTATFGTVGVKTDGVSAFTDTRNVTNPTVQTVTLIPKGSITTTLNAASIVLPDFDYLKITYAWASAAGSDLDTMTGLVGTGTIYDADYVGFAQGNAKVPSGATTPYLWWAGDNTVGGKETILVDYKQFILENGATPNPIDINLYAVWYAGKLTGDVTVGITTYKNGTMSLDAPNFDFINTGGSVVSDVSFNKNVVPQSTSGLVANAQYIGVVHYDKTTFAASLILA